MQLLHLNSRIAKVLSTSLEAMYELMRGLASNMHIKLQYDSKLSGAI